MLEIKLLNSDMVAIVDTDTHGFILSANWKKCKLGYVYTYAWGKRFSLHRVVLNSYSGPLFVDHINGNPLDNRKANLRICTHAQNLKNSKTPVNNTTGYKGVYKTENGKFYAQLRNGPWKAHLGTFASSKEAALAYDKAASENYGDFARLNFPKPSEVA